MALPKHYRNRQIHRVRGEGAYRRWVSSIIKDLVRGDTCRNGEETNDSSSPERYPRWQEHEEEQAVSGLSARS